jgi:hypothetical protein
VFGPVRHQATRIRELAPAVNGGQIEAGDHPCNLHSSGREEGALSDEQNLHIRAHDLGGHSVQIAYVDLNSTASTTASSMILMHSSRPSA